MRRPIGVCGALVFLLATFCTVPIMQRSLVTAPSSLDRKAQYLKAHLRNGDLYVLSQWTVDAAEKNVTGVGRSTTIRIEK